jgi:hypothetical protein
LRATVGGAGSGGSIGAPPLLAPRLTGELAEAAVSRGLIPLPAAAFDPRDAPAANLQADTGCAGRVPGGPQRPVRNVACGAGSGLVKVDGGRYG